MPHESCGSVLLVLREPLQRSEDVVAEDRLGATEPPEGLESKPRRSGGPLLRPQSLQHELQKGRLDVLARERRIVRAAEVDTPCGDLVEQRVDERRLGDVALARELAVALERADDCLARRPAIEPLEPQHVGEDARQTVGERVELGERVIAQRDQHVHPESRTTQQLGERLTEPAVGAVMEEVLLELVEQEIRLTALLRCRRDGVDEAGRRAELRGGGMRCCNHAGLGLDRPLSVHDHCRAAQLAQTLCDTCPQQGALADAARSEENGQPIRDHIGDDRLTLALAAEEEERVERRVGECGKTLERARWQTVHARLPRMTCSSSTMYAAGAMSITSTSRRRQNSRSSGCGPACTDQDR